MIIYKPLGDRKFQVTGELPEGTRWCKIVIAGREKEHYAPQRVKDAKKIIENAILIDQAPAPYYTLIPVKAPAGSMSEETKEKLKKYKPE